LTLGCGCHRGQKSRGAFPGAMPESTGINSAALGRRNRISNIDGVTNSLAH
jgi:hypothetical protein